LHEWSPGETAVGPIIEAHTTPGETILDPFAGSGAFGRKAVEMGRRWIGCDIKQWGGTTA
jgi:DNA modification methylase